MQLFEAIVPTNEQHPNFAKILGRGNGYYMDVLTDWARGFVDRDNKFVREFQTSFNSSFWELYLHAVLKHYGMKPDFSFSAPDFVLPCQNFCIEAVTASNAFDRKPEHEKDWREIPKEFTEFNRLAIIRTSNSLVSKHKKYLESYARLPQVAERPFVIAISSFDQPHSHMECQRPVEAVLYRYYVDEDQIIASGSAEVPIEGDYLDHVLKDSGSPIELGMFESPAYKEVSAVIFNSTATSGKATALSSDPNPDVLFIALRSNSSSVRPTVIQAMRPNYSEHLIDGLRIYHNPFATHPLDPALFRHPLVFQTNGFEEDDFREQRDGLLLFRSLIRMVPE